MLKNELYPYKKGEYCEIEYDKDGDVKSVHSKLHSYSKNSISYYSKPYEVIGVLKYIFKKVKKSKKD